MRPLAVPNIVSPRLFSRIGRFYDHTCTIYQPPTARVQPLDEYTPALDSFGQPKADQGPEDMESRAFRRDVPCRVYASPYRTGEVRMVTSAYSVQEVIILLSGDHHDLTESMQVLLDDGRTFDVQRIDIDSMGAQTKVFARIVRI